MKMFNWLTRRLDKVSRSYSNETKIDVGIASVVVLAFCIFGVYTHSPAHAITSPSVTPNTQAALAVATLNKWYNPATYNSTGWWESANAVGATIDYMQKSGSRAYLGDVQGFYNAHKSTNFIVNSYYDDEGWWALTWLKAYKLTGDTAYLNTSKAIFTNMTGGWDSTCGGGLWWTTAKTYKNAIPNELFLDIATQLHIASPGDTVYLGWANKEQAWFQNSGLIGSNNLVYDGLGSSCLPLTTSDTWTYNQGVIIGGLVNLYNITNNAALLTSAENIANAVMSSPTLSPNGILTEPCEATAKCDEDNTIFKGVFVQNLKLLYDQTGNAAYQTYLENNAKSIWASDMNATNQFGLKWTGPFDLADAGRQTSAVNLFNTQELPLTTLSQKTSTTIYSGMTGFCVDDWHDGSANNNVVDLFSCNGSMAQTWTINSNGTIGINGKCLDLYQANTSNDGKVDLWPCNGGKTQQWQVESDATIYNKDSGKCLDDPGWSTTGGTQLDIYTCNGGNNQIWYTPS
jgi:predicted alpha-1,6-mannanase (GH76 family)